MARVSGGLHSGEACPRGLVSQQRAPVCCIIRKGTDMNLADVIALAKSGYKKKDIDELLALEIAEEAEPEAENGAKEPPQDEPDPEPTEPSIDIENLRRENEELKNQLSELQKKNREKSVADPGDAAAERAKRLAERAKDFM